MSLAHGPKGVKSGLVFYYDSANRKSWVGEPTTNEFVTTMLRGNYGGDGVIQTGVADAFGKNTPVYRKTGKIRFGNTSSIDEGTLYFGNTYTFSIYLRLTENHTSTAGFELDIVDRQTTLRVDGDVITDNPRNHMTTDWRRFSVTATHNNAAAYRFIDLGIYQSTTNEFEWCCPQLEEKAYPTPFVGSWGSSQITRSTTQALLDLSKESTSINAGSLNFLSNGEFDFNGSSNHIPTGLFNGRDPSSEPFTVEAWVKSDVTSGAKMWVDVGSNGSNQRFYSALIHPSAGIPLGIQGVGWSRSTPYDSQWHQQVIVMDGNTARAYCDGVEVHSRTYTPYTLPGHILIGGRSGYYWDGKIDIAKIYDRALSPTEVKENFEATRSRFGL